MARWVVGFAIGALSIWVAMTVAGGFSGTVGGLRHLEIPWLVAAFVVEAASYVVLGAKFRRLIGSGVLGLVESVELGLVLSGFGPLTPASPAEGLALTASHLRRRGLTGRRITIVFGLAQWFSTRAFLLLSSINLLIVAAIERHSFGDLWPFVVAAVVVLVLLGLTERVAATPSAFERISAIVGAFRRRSRRHTVAERRAAAAAWHREATDVLGSRRHRVSLFVLTAVPLLADVACLWFALRSAHSNVGFDVALLAVTVAAASAFVPLVPGGLGIVEVAIPAVTYHFGVPYSQGIAAALAYRALGTFIPAGAGAISIYALRAHAGPRAT